MFLSLSKLIDFSKTKETENIKVDYILYFTRDKSKKLIINLQPDDDLITIEQNYIGEYENFIPNFGHSINQYKYLLLDTRNKYNEFILNNTFKPYLYLKKGYYELYYLKIIVKTELISESTINQYYKAQSKSFDFIRNDYYFFNPKNKKQIKTDEIYKYTKKRKKYEKVNFTLFNDSIQIIKQNKHEFIPIYYIISINSSDFDEKYRLLKIMIGFPEKIKDYRIAIPKKTFNIWESLIYNQFISIKGIYEFNMYKEEISSLIKKKNGLFVQIIDKNDNFKEKMMIDEKIRNYLFEKITNENVKKLIQLIINYKLNFNSKEYKECYNNLNKIINLLSCDKELYEKKEDLDNLINISKKYKLNKNENNDNISLLLEILNLVDPIFLFCYNKYIINFINELNEIKSNPFNNIFYYLQSKNDLINFEEYLEK